jgi:hypothetical protein
LMLRNGGFVICGHGSASGPGTRTAGVEGGRALGASGIAQLFDATGKFVKQIGRSGRGPGEYNRARAIGVTAHDSILVFDEIQGKVLTFANTGAFVRETRIKLSRPEGSHPDYGLAVTGFFGSGTPVYLASSIIGREVPFNNKFTSLKYVGDDIPGSVVATNLPLTLDPAAQPGAWINRSVAQLGKRRLLFSDGWTSALKAFSEDGKLEWIARPSLTHRAATKQELVDYSRMRLNVFFRGDTAKMAKSDREYPMYYPEFLPTVGSILEDDEGNVWVGEYRLTADQIQPWHVFDDDGAWLGDIVPPAGWRIRAVRGDIVVISRKDESDLDRIYVHKLTK